MVRFRIIPCALGLFITVLGCGDDSGSGVQTGALCDTSEAQNALSGTCAAPLGDLLACWMPQGSCTANIELSGDFEIVFENDAVLETSIDGTSASGRYLNPQGSECGTFEVPSGSTEVEISTTGGESFSIGTDGVVMCANGETVQLDDIQRRAIEACTAANANTCETPDIGDLPDIPTGDDLMCTQDSDCPRVGGEQWLCCVNIPITGQRFCNSPQACAFL